MPELPEVEHLRRTLLPILMGRTIAGVRVRRPDVISGPRRPWNLLSGAAVADLRRHGKQLAIIADDGRAICIHLGMTGQVIAPRAGTPLPKNDHVHIVWRLAGPDNGRAGAAARLVFRDPRRFGGVATFASVADLMRRAWSGLGPDALRVSGGALARRLAGSRRSIKAALLDQSVLAGVGNIYADESLFRARLSPFRPAGGVTAGEFARLSGALRVTLSRAIERGGSSLRDYVDANAAAGRFQRLHLVYGRAGLPCARCGRGLSRGITAQRTTVWCPDCQR